MKTPKKEMEYCYDKNYKTLKKEILQNQKMNGLHVHGQAELILQNIATKIRHRFKTVFINILMLVFIEREEKP